MNPDVTELLIDLRSGDEHAVERLFPLIYNEMRAIAASQLGREFGSSTFQQTELVHEAFMKMVDQTRIHATDRKHFYNISARCMRQILVDHARKKNAQKRGGDFREVSLDMAEGTADDHLNNLLEIDRYLEELRSFDERKAEVVELKFFGGLSNEHIGEILDVSSKTVSRDWTHARGWLYDRINSDR